MTNEFPEAPLSIHIDGYYKGFHTGITIRKDDNSIIPTTSITSTIDSLIEKGFKPSWNEETNGKASPKKPIVDQETCEHKETTVKESTGHSIPTNKGRRYIACLDCNKFISWKETETTSEPNY